MSIIQLRKLMELCIEFKNKNDKMKFKYEADGSCVIMSTKFIEFLSKKKFRLEAELINFWNHERGYRLNEYSFYHAKTPWYKNYNKSVHPGHTVVLIDNNIVIDFTARQYDESAPFPLIYNFSKNITKSCNNPCCQTTDIKAIKSIRTL